MWGARYLAAPHAAVDHLAQLQGARGEVGPPPAQADLEKAPHEAPRALGHVHHVRGQGQALQLQLADVRLRR